MDNGYKDPDFDELIDSTSSSSVSSSDSPGPVLFDRNEPYILELHELKRESAKTGNPEKTDKHEKVKRLRKKKKEGKKGTKSKTPQSSSSPSEASIKPHSDLTKEEFYDAHESYHGLNPVTHISSLANPTAGAAVMQTISDHGADLKINPPSTAPADVVADAARKAISIFGITQ